MVHEEKSAHMQNGKHSVQYQEKTSCHSITAIYQGPLSPADPAIYSLLNQMSPHISLATIRVCIVQNPKSTEVEEARKTWEVSMCLHVSV